MFKHLLCFAAIVPMALCFAEAQEVTGDWLATLAMPNGDLRLALHVTKSDGGLKATFDSIDQGVRDLPVTSIKLTDSILTFSLTAPSITFEGKVDTGGTQIDGTISGPAGSIPVTFRRGLIPKVEHKPAQPSDIDGEWTGTLEGQEYLFHITNTEDGLIVAMDLASQHIKGAEASGVTRKDSSIAMEWKAFGSRFEGKIADDRKSIDGNVTQAGNNLPFSFKRVQPAR